MRSTSFYCLSDLEMPRRKRKTILLLGVGLLLAGLVLLVAGWQVRLSRLESIAYAGTTTATSPVTVSTQFTFYVDPPYVRDAVMNWIKVQHPETASLMANLVWSGGVKPYPLGQLGAGRYEYLSGQWNVSITYPIVPNPPYTCQVSYTDLRTEAYRVSWRGIYQSGAVTEESYSFSSGTGFIATTTTTGPVWYTYTTSTPFITPVAGHDWLLYLSIVLAVAGASLVAFHFLKRPRRKRKR